MMTDMFFEVPAQMQGQNFKMLQPLTTKHLYTHHVNMQGERERSRKVKVYCLKTTVDYVLEI